MNREILYHQICQKEKPVIKSLSVETYGVDYGTPETVEPFDYQSYLSKLYGTNGNSTNSSVTSNTSTEENSDKKQYK